MYEKRKMKNASRALVWLLRKSDPSLGLKALNSAGFRFMRTLNTDVFQIVSRNREGVPVGVMVFIKDIEKIVVLLDLLSRWDKADQEGDIKEWRHDISLE